MPSWRELAQFCKRDQWELYRDTDHLFYRKLMPNGTLKRTKVSKSSGEISSGLWKQILCKQLQVDQEYFNKMK